MKLRSNTQFSQAFKSDNFFSALLIYKEGEAYKVTVFKRSGLRRKLKPETYLLQEENGNLFMNTGFRIDVSYNEATDILTFSPNGDYVRVNPKPDHPIGKQ